jgi:hypothetical protein
MGTLLDLASLVVVPSGYKEDKIYSVVPTDGSGDLDFTRASSATRVNSAGLIESVATGVPRLDYSQGSCPSLLLEPQRTNLLLRSEEFDDAVWSGGVTLLINSNATTAPNDTLTADRIVGDGTIGVKNLNASNVSIVSGTTYTLSCFAKQDSSLPLQLWFSATPFGTTQYANFNLNTGQITFQGAGVISAKIETLINGWYRCSITATAITTTTTSPGGVALTDFTTSRRPSFSTSSGLFLWGAQLEEGSYPTSYIPTLGTSVTRVADAASKTGISSLIGQTEGTIFLDFEGGANDSIDYVYGINDGTTNNRIIIYRSSSNTIITQVRVGGGSEALIQTATVNENTRHKCAVAYKLNDIAFYVNGVQIGLDTSATIPTCSVLATNDGGGASLFGRSINQALLFKTRLSNTELAQLTTL